MTTKAPSVSGFQCTTCGEYHEFMSRGWACPLPEVVENIPKRDRRKRVLMNADQCIVDDELYCVVGRITIPIDPRQGTFEWVAWVSLMPEDFAEVYRFWKKPGRENMPAFRGTLQNRLPYMQTTLGLDVMVHTQPVGVRPKIRVHPQDHEIGQQQRRGISFDQFQRITERMLHD